MTRIRSIAEQDIPEVIEMAHALAAHHGDVATLTADDLRRDALGDVPWIHVLIAPGQGYAALSPLVQLQFGVRGMDLHHMFVMPEARGLGVGRALLAACVDVSKGEGCRYLMVGTHPDNRDAQAAYLSMGFSVRDGVGPRFLMRW